MQITKIIVLSGLALSIMACSTPRQQAVTAPAQNHQEYVLRGFSLSIPASEGWNVARQGPLDIVLARQGQQVDERYAIQALVVELPEFKNDEEFKKFIETRMHMMYKKSDSRIVEVQSQLVPGQSAMCVQSHTRERAAAEPAAKGMLELVNFTCRYPNKQNVGVYLAYSKRSSVASVDENIASQANALFKNMSFRDL